MKLGICKGALSSMSKLLSARTRSPGINLFNSPQCSVMNLSDARPTQPFEINDTVPWGVIPIRHFAVLWCLYEDQVWARASKHEGLSIKTSKQSIMPDSTRRQLLSEEGW